MYVEAYKRSARQYADVHNATGIADDSPHRLIQMLMDGFLARVNSAKGAMLHGDMEAKSLYMSKAIGIIGGLNESLDVGQGGDLALNLRGLYDYINMRLLQASHENSTEKLDEVAGLMREIKEAWDAIGQ
ncbi:MAG: flagellar export chaperone FliS [Methylomonas sp.]|nr:MAG: flagellar export chaperone FliS [Methylomonas sp.]PPD27001.1 MAG: flagellar export chaperone FliS [Methylomonas sp.]PPD38940.1 MAG: flagellar export chaperone FliS [Methylomonas sp.]PPD42576.1 MAG: flagellar export chaperone FliS [Methylomonas sp.]PPD54152.1 MAG: flagellar export chaperone FliS [Methylomonas sp.]